MKKKLLLITLLLPLILLSSLVFSQTNIQKEINEQVWKPFISTFSNNDQKGFAAVHSKDIIRVLQDDGKIWGHTQYFPADKQDNGAQQRRDIELRFIQRIAENEKAFEIGYYKTTMYAPDGSPRSFYGKFHVVLRKEAGIWKILVDADTSKDVKKEDFEKGKALN